MNFISSTTIFAALVLGSFFSAQACAGDAAHAKLIEHLLTDVDSSNVPPGYDFLTTEGFAICDAAADRKIEGAIHALFSRKSRLPGSRKFDTGTEAIVYFVFPTSEDALQYSNRDSRRRRPCGMVGRFRFISLEWSYNNNQGRIKGAARSNATNAL